MWPDLLMRTLIYIKKSVEASIFELEINMLIWILITCLITSLKSMYGPLEHCSKAPSFSHLC